jgi:hypothetical protein
VYSCRRGLGAAYSTAQRARAFGYVDEGIEPLAVSATVEGDVERDEVDLGIGLGASSKMALLWATIAS